MTSDRAFIFYLSLHCGKFCLPYFTCLFIVASLVFDSNAKIICQDQGQISRSHFRKKKNVIRALVFHKDSSFPEFSPFPTMFSISIFLLVMTIWDCFGKSFKSNMQQEKEWSKLGTCT